MKKKLLQRTLFLIQHTVRIKTEEDMMNLFGFGKDISKPDNSQDKVLAEFDEESFNSDESNKDEEVDDLLFELTMGKTV